jgi:HNH endonuclease
MPANQNLLDSLRPTTYRKIYECAIDLRLDLNPWHFDKGGNSIDPSSSTHQNSLWVYGGGGKPYAACLWWDELELRNGEIVRETNLREVIKGWEARKIDERNDPSVARHLSPKIRKARQLDAAVFASRRTCMPMNVILLDGDRTNAEQAAYDSSSASFRKVDCAEWYVHHYDVNSGDFQLVRGVPAHTPAAPDPFDNVADPGLDPAFLDTLEAGDLSETEKKALIRLRVGQGWFRDKLVERWKGCSVSEVRTQSFLIASHIKPWSQCESREERLSPANGLLLTPNLDKLFDRGFITFHDRSEMVISSELGQYERALFNISQNSRLRVVFEDMRPYLKWHRENVFERWRR